MLLKDLKLHDCSVEKMHLNFSNNEIIIEFGIYNDEKSDYDYFEITFYKVAIISLEKLEVNDASSIEVHSCEINEYITPISIKFVFLLGFSKPSSELSFSCSGYKIFKTF